MYANKSRKKETEFLKRKTILIDRDIKTLHFNQKVLQSTVRDLHKDLRIYGEVKKSKIRGIFNETAEEE